MGFSGCDIDKDFLPAFTERLTRWTRAAAIFDLPFANYLLGSLPITHFERFAYFRTGQEAVHPDWALAMSVPLTFRPVLTVLAMAVNRQLSAFLQTQRLCREPVAIS